METTEQPEREKRVQRNLPHGINPNALNECISPFGASVERINAQEVTAKVDDQLSAFILPTDVYLFQSED